MTKKHLIIFALLILAGLALGQIHHGPQAMIDNSAAVTTVVVPEPDGGNE